MSNEAREQVALILKNCEVTYSASPAGEQTRDGWKCDAWRVSFTVRDGRAAHEEFDYFTGLGHRAPATNEQKMRAAWGFQGLTANDKAGRTSYGRRYLAEVEKLRKPQAPDAADVLYSLLLDSDAVGQSFASWCSDFGYDTDSRKAFATYEACQSNADKLGRIFDATARAALREALADF